MAPREAELIALSDQDDRWYPEKLEVLREAIGPAQLVYSDLRRVGVDGRVRAESLWEGRRRSHDNLASLVISNTVVGAASMFRRRVADYALPFPVGPGWNFHDHWLAAVALSLGEIAYVDRPLQDYVQHPGAVLGRVAAGPGAAAPAARGLGARIARWRGFLARWRFAYFRIYLQRDFHARLLLARCASELTPRKRRALRLIAAAARSPLALAWLAIRPALALFGRNETLRLETTMVRGILWRHLVALAALGRTRPRWPVADASPPSPAAQRGASRQRRWLARS